MTFYLLATVNFISNDAAKSWSATLDRIHIIRNNTVYVLILERLSDDQEPFKIINGEHIFNWEQ